MRIYVCFYCLILTSAISKKKNITELLLLFFFVIRLCGTLYTVKIKFYRLSFQSFQPTVSDIGVISSSKKYALNPSSY